MFRPIAHYAPCTGDCIPFFWNGEYHNFILRDGGWAHVKSRDLVHWETLPMALEKGAPGDPDSDYCFTGCILERQGTFHIFYPGVSAAHPKGTMQMMHATSKDLVHFTKHPEETWGPDGVHYRTQAQCPPEQAVQRVELPTFKDQCVIWNERAGKWWMFFSAQPLPVAGPYCALAVSDDLIRWTQVDTVPGLDRGDCTDIFQIGPWWYRISYVEAWRAKELAGPWERIDDFDTRHLLVPKRMFDGRRHVLLGGMRELAGRIDPNQYRQMVVCLPREMYADAAGQLRTRPVPEVTAFFNRPVASPADGARPAAVESIVTPWEKEPRKSWQEVEGVLTGCLGEPFERARCWFDAPADYMLKASFRLSPSATLTIGFRDQCPGGSGACRLAISPRNQEIELVSPAETFTRKCPLDAAQPVRVQAFVQGPMIECWVNDAYAFTLRAYDYPAGKLGLEAVGGRVGLLGLTLSVAERDGKGESAGK